MLDYGNDVYTDIHLIYGQEGGNGRLALSMHQEQYPRLNVRTILPSRTSIDTFGRRDPSKQLGVMQGKNAFCTHLEQKTE